MHKPTQAVIVYYLQENHSTTYEDVRRRAKNIGKPNSAFPPICYGSSVGGCSYLLSEGRTIALVLVRVSAKGGLRALGLEKNTLAAIIKPQG